jgi:hypothetical protein
MALVFTNRAADPDNTDATSYATPAFTPSASAGILVAIWNSKASAPDLASLDTPSWLTAAGWTTEIDNAVETARRLTVFSGFTVASPGSAALTATFGATQTGCVIIVDDVTGQDLTDFVLQPIDENEATGNTASITLGSGLASAESAIWSACGINVNEAQAPTGGETELGDVGTTAPVTHLQTQFRINATTSSVSWASSTAQVVIGALEVKAATAAIEPRGREPILVPNPAQLAAIERSRRW